MPVTREFLRHTLSEGGWTTSEYIAIKWQYGELGDFDALLMETIAKSDAQNREKLRLGFPQHVIGYLQWMNGDLQFRLHQAEGEFYKTVPV
jgi:hypothetical protein